MMIGDGGISAAGELISTGPSGRKFGKYHPPRSASWKSMSSEVGEESIEGSDCDSSVMCEVI